MNFKAFERKSAIKRISFVGIILALVSCKHVQHTYSPSLARAMDANAILYIANLDTYRIEAQHEEKYPDDISVLGDQSMPNDAADVETNVGSGESGSAAQNTSVKVTTGADAGGLANTDDAQARDANTAHTGIGIIFSFANPHEAFIQRVEIEVQAIDEQGNVMQGQDKTLVVEETLRTGQFNSQQSFEPIWRDVDVYCIDLMRLRVDLVNGQTLEDANIRRLGLSQNLAQQQRCQH